jgi:hypothetical protein
MTISEIQCLKDNVDKIVEIETTSGERLIAKVLFVNHSEEYDEHDLLYEVVETNMPEFYASHKDCGGFVMDFEYIVSVKPFSNPDPNRITASGEARS